MTETSTDNWQVDKILTDNWHLHFVPIQSLFWKIILLKNSTSKASTTADYENDQPTATSKLVNAGA